MKSAKTGVNTGTIIYVKHRATPPKGKNCTKCKMWSKGYCKEFKMKITDNTNATVCQSYNCNSDKKDKPTSRRHRCNTCQFFEFRGIKYYCVEKKIYSNYLVLRQCTSFKKKQ